MDIKNSNNKGEDQRLSIKKFNQHQLESTIDFLNRRYFEKELQSALIEGQIDLVYQPQYCLNTNKIIAAEALVRWHHPTIGKISPGQFIPLFEKSGLIIPLGKWIFDKACRQLQYWHSNGYEVKLSINFSFAQLHQENLIETIIQTLTKNKVDPAFLVFELTETMTIHNIANFISIIDDIRTLGIHIALDDFGTGYNSLSYLAQLNVDVLKIDKSFINKINNSKKDKIVFLSIVSLAKQLDLPIVVEGIETKEQMEFVKKVGCNIIQGFYFSEPIGGEDFGKLLVKMN